MNKLIKAAIVVIACSSIYQSALAAEQSDKTTPGQLVSVETAKQQEVSPSIWLPGNVVSRANTPISAEQTGQLLWLEEIGSQVEQGQVIAKIDNRSLKLQLNRQRAQVKQQQAEVAYLTKQKKRMSALNQTNNTALSELERIEKDLAVAQNEVTALTMLVEQTKLDIEKSTIKAPFAGNISQRFANLGELVSPGRPLLQLVDTKHLDIRIAAPLSIAPYLKSANKVLMKSEDRLIELPIRTWSQAGEQNSRTFDVRLAADNLPLLTGSAVTVALPKQRPTQATLVPRDALVLREQDIYVLTVDPQEQAQKVSVLVGQGVGDWVAVSGNVNPGDTVIVRGAERLQAGQKVRIDKTLVAKLN